MALGVESHGSSLFRLERISPMLPGKGARGLGFESDAMRWPESNI
jgi:hypothetical protein